MIDPKAVQVELTTWIAGMEPEAVCAVIFKAEEVATFYLMTAQVQAMFEEADADPEAVEVLDSMRAKVRAVLEQAGYGPQADAQNGAESDEQPPQRGVVKSGGGEEGLEDDSEPADE